MADIKMRQRSPTTIKTLDRAKIAGDHLRIKSAKVRAEFDARERSDENSPEKYALGRSEGAFRASVAATYAGSMHGGRTLQGKLQRRDRYSNSFDESMKEFQPDIQGGGNLDIRTRRQNTEIRARKVLAERARNKKKVRAEDAVRMYEAESLKMPLVGNIITGEHAVAKLGRSASEISNVGVVTSNGAISANQMAAGRVYKNKKIARMAESNAFRTREYAKSVSKKARQSISLTLKAARRIAESAKAMTTALAAGGGVTIIIVMTFIFFGAAFYFFGDESSKSYIPVSAEVEAYTQVISKYANEYGIGEYVDLIKAVMMQESGGRGTDPMQCSESPYNTKYSKAPGSIKDPEYSINCGVHYLADCLKSAGVKNPLDMDRIRLALQGYNYGNGYISWAIHRDGGYTVENASAFSDEQAKKHGWSGYGDKQYVAHVLRYYPYGSYNIGVGNGVIVQVAAQQIGNVGGKKFWSWYGFSGRVEWCACYVSWCADQCGYLKSGTIPKFAAVGDGVDWFKSRGQFQTRSYKPAPGDIIFFDWGADGTRDHVGIVEKCDGRTVYTIEGNSGDACKRLSYVVGSSCIYGYGVPKY